LKTDPRQALSALSVGARGAAWVALGLLVAAFLTLEIYSFRFFPSDEGIYFYAASLISQGHFPYRDFFLAHPPLRFLALAALFGVQDGFPFLLLKCLSPAAAVGTALCLFDLVRRRVAPPLVGYAAAVVAVGAFLFCEFTLKSAGHELGVFEGLFFVAAAAWLLDRGRARLAGVCGAVAVLTSLLCAPLLLVLAGAWLRTAGPGRRALGGLVMTLVVLHLLLLAICGWPFVEQVYLFHLNKVRSPETVRLAFAAFGREAAGFVALALGGLLLSLGKKGPERAVALGAGAALLVHLFAVATRPTAFPYYLIPALLPAGLLVGLGVAVESRWAASLVIGGRRGPGVTLGVAAVALASWTIWEVSFDLASRVWPPPPRVSGNWVAPWRDALALGRLNRIVERMFWTDGPASGSAVSRYLQQAMSAMDLDAAVSLIRRLREENPATTLFGDPRVVPYVALLSGSPITGHVADVTDQRFASGQASASSLVELLRQAEAPVVILASRRQMLPAPVEAYVRRTFTRVADFESSPTRWHEVYARGTSGARRERDP
jgi:hypothetical protein